jgi:hypothetical protein
MRARNFKGVCVSCGEEFAAGKRTDKTCSTTCRTAYNESLKRVNGTRARQRNRFRSQHPEYMRNYNLVRKFGITLEQYNEMLEAQGGVCAVCHKPPKVGAKAHAVDHDHKTGEIFGLLCFGCNHRLIGRIRDPVLFQRAGEYLKKGTGLFVPVKMKRGSQRSRKVKNGSNTRSKNTTA